MLILYLCINVTLKLKYVQGKNGPPSYNSRLLWQISIL